MADIEIKLNDLLAGQHEAGRSIGFREGYLAGLDAAVERVKLQLEQRSGSAHDVGKSVLNDTLRRLAARPSDIDPTAEGGER